MCKEKILEILENAKDGNGTVPMRLVRQAFDKLPEPCEDTISRQAAIDAVNNAFDRETLLTGFVRSIAVRAIRDMPSAQRNGTWITDTNDNNNAYCSECGLHTTKDLLKRIALVGENKPKFCPNCGAKMEDKEW